MLPLRTPTLPPATHTNTSFVGAKRFWIVDPATPYDDERPKLLQAIDELEGQGAQAVGIVLTHHHIDHVGAASWLKEERGLPILAHPITADLLQGRIVVDHPLVEGDELKGSDAATDTWRVMHTPGHASGHIVLWNEALQLLVGGDMVAEIGTILIEPPDGHMANYLRELSRLRDLAPRWLVPAHGEVIDRPVEHIEYYISHRLGREAKVLGNLSESAQELSAITAASYDDVPKALHVLAQGSTLAHLIKLEEDGKARRVGGSWRIGPAA